MMRASETVIARILYNNYGSMTYQSLLDALNIFLNPEEMIQECCESGLIETNGKSVTIRFTKEGELYI